MDHQIIPIRSRQHDDFEQRRATTRAEIQHETVVEEVAHQGVLHSMLDVRSRDAVFER